MQDILEAQLEILKYTCLLVLVRFGFLEFLLGEKKNNHMAVVVVIVVVIVDFGHIDKEKEEEPYLEKHMHMMNCLEPGFQCFHNMLLLLMDL